MRLAIHLDKSRDEQIQPRAVLTRIQFQITPFREAQAALVEAAEIAVTFGGGGVRRSNVHWHPTVIRHKVSDPTTVAGIDILSFVFGRKSRTEMEPSRYAARPGQRDEKRMLIGAAAAFVIEAILRASFAG